ncbi:type IV secretion system DNA-binding domain-containing protein [Glutamicibacter halophytocola]|nr:type IV secretion system DNA-binding domain-containing protein [Glutamicibacter halophytocola]
MKIKSQRQFDLERQTYLLRFPADLAADRVAALLRVLASGIRPGITRFMGVETIVFETRSNGAGITHRMIVPRPLAERITAQVRHHLPGVIIELDRTRTRPHWDDVIEVGMSNGSRQLSFNNATDLSTALLTAASQAMNQDEELVLQWVLSPSAFERFPSKEMPVASNGFGLVSSLLQETASREEVEDRRAKLSEANFLAIGRIASVAKSRTRARYLNQGVFDVLKTADSHSTRFKLSVPRDLIEGSRRINEAVTPWLFPAQVNVLELSALLGIPIGNPFIPGLPRPSARQLFATEEVARTGRLIGTSNYPGHKRPIALSYDQADKHAFIAGGTGSGKSTLMANWAAQDMANGYGVIVIDASNSDSEETLFNRTLSYVPHHRLSDVIVMDVNKSKDRPVGFNVFDQGHSHMVVDQISNLIQHLYSESKGVWTRELIHHGLYALIDHGNTTLMDLMTLIRPDTESEKVWAKSVIRSVKDVRIRRFWDDWLLLKEEERKTKSQPIYDRLWQFSNRPEIHNILGQEKSAFQTRDVLANNRILLVNLAGLPEETAGLLGTLIFQSLWTTAQGLSPEKTNFIYLDEVQQMTRTSINLADLMARGRKHKFALVSATQYLEGSKIDDETKAAIINNTGTKVIFSISEREAKLWRGEFGKQVTYEDFVNNNRYDAYAKIANSVNNGAPVSLTAIPPLAPFNLGELAKKLSDTKYGLPVEQLEQQILNRRTPEPVPENQRPNFGRRKLND